MSLSRARAGFTLIEVMIVIAIIAIIAVIAIPSLLSARMSANESAAIGNLRTWHSSGLEPEQYAQSGYTITFDSVVGADGVTYSGVRAMPDVKDSTGRRCFWIDGRGSIRQASVWTLADPLTWAGPDSPAVE